jgi:hypothetical protein
MLIVSTPDELLLLLPDDPDDEPHALSSTGTTAARLTSPALR